LSPPPLTPPHKGEGNRPAVVDAFGLTLESLQQRLLRALFSPPPCGEGLGVGGLSTRRQAEPKLTQQVAHIAAFESVRFFDSTVVDTARTCRTIVRPRMNDEQAVALHRSKIGAPQRDQVFTVMKPAQAAEA